jgi:hypothetical protein
VVCCKQQPLLAPCCCRWHKHTVKDGVKLLLKTAQQHTHTKVIFGSRMRWVRGGSVHICFLHGHVFLCESHCCRYNID